MNKEYFEDGLNKPGEFSLGIWMALDRGWRAVVSCRLSTWALAYIRSLPPWSRSFNNLFMSKNLVELRRNLGYEVPGVVPNEPWRDFTLRRTIPP